MMSIKVSRLTSRYSLLTVKLELLNIQDKNKKIPMNWITLKKGNMGKRGIINQV